ncbi:MAG: ABC transporter permease, partial [Candidatus Promineifilaceae bacterium]
SSSSQQWVEVIVRDQGNLAGVLQSILESSKVIVLEEIDVSEADAEELVADNEYAAVLIIPLDYSDRLLEGQPLPLNLITDASSSAGAAVNGEVQSAALHLQSAVSAASVSSAFYEQEVGFSSDQDREILMERAFKGTVEAWRTPPISIAAQQSAALEEDSEEETESSNAYTQSSPGMMAQFAIAGLMGASAILVIERKNRVLRRLLTTAITRTEILVGHFSAMFVMIFVQLIILILFGQLLLRLNYASHPGATALMAVATALFAASLGLLIGALAKTEEQTIVFAMIPMFLLSGLGGAWVPLEIMPEGFQQFARITPLAFVMDGFQDILIRDQGFEAIILNAIVLLAMAVVIFAFAAWRFRYE